MHLDILSKAKKKKLKNEEKKHEISESKSFNMPHV